ncbi:hypothetical protein A8924_2160 [Saccharopolyspora erythraea NRRL 2338]|nr:hypothetical protein [Saccharopolyspora erythraea]EQD82797.1 hypothetical protein N599_28770 [Saccharopolyspora erythraea D]PFG94860.1 hypothetical protein A8924_2160 [Saccharopolyspora erythraea NRRL 2338]QRK91561.1 hypothetical protein JQX30_09345 [Saccharopolyspora erythraea]
MRSARWGGAAAVALLLAMPSGAVASAQAQPVPEPRERCRVGDSDLDELSGLASDGRSWYAVNDGGSSLEVYVLDPADCSVRDVRTGSANPYDVEDLALGADGTLWLADTGDNDRDRDSIALHALSPRGGSTLYRLTYPNGPRDAEALLLDRAGVPYIVTKEPIGPAGVYRPAGALAPGGTVPMERVGTISLRSTNTPGGPLSGSIGSVLVTGGAASRDGTVAAIRTYTELYLFDAPDGDLAAAFARPPVRVSVPGEPQGEAIAWEPDGTLLTASEGTGEPVRALAGAADLARNHPPDTPPTPTRDGGGEGSGDNASPPVPPPSTTGADLSNGQLLLLCLGAAGVLVFLTRRARRKQ